MLTQLLSLETSLPDRFFCQCRDAERLAPQRGPFSYCDCPSVCVPTFVHFKAVFVAKAPHNKLHFFAVPRNDFYWRKTAVVVCD